MHNGHKEFHVAAVLKRNKTFWLGVSNRTNSVRMSFTKRGDQGHMVTVFRCHAEQDVLRRARRGDTLYIYRWTKTGIIKDSRPCEGCMALLRRIQISTIYYHKNGVVVKERIS